MLKMNLNFLFAIIMETHVDIVKLKLIYMTCLYINKMLMGKFEIKTMVDL